jgi:uncharacterized protein YgiM (DUF1202 family)
MNPQKQTIWNRYGRWLLALFLALLFGMNLGVLIEFLQPDGESASAGNAPATSVAVVPPQQSLPPDAILAAGAAPAIVSSSPAADASLDVQIMVQANVESSQQGRVKAIATGPQTVQAAASVNGAGNAAARIGVDQSVEVQAHGQDGGAVEANAIGPGTARARAFVDGTGVQTGQSNDQSSTLPAGSLLNPANIGGTVQANSVSRVVIAGPFVNVREGPGLAYSILTQVTSGQQFQVLGLSSDGGWWQICCINNAVGWVTGQYALPVDAVGQSLVGAAPTASAPVNLPPTATPIPPTAILLPPTPTSTPTLEFSVVRSEQFLETVHPRLYVFMEDVTLYNGAGSYRVRVRKDGVELPNNIVSFAGIPLLTWPWTHDDRQRPYNLKIEFEQTPPAGVWEVTPLDSVGREVGPPVVFTLQPDDRYQEMYVRFQRRVN